jgi:aspartyl-tRNA(Asn)/glutamyl-tRNA(Gln) amidotransferase subunit C
MAKLTLTEDERQWASGLADKLKESLPALEAIDTEGVEPLITVLDVQNVFREDVAVKMLTREELLSNAPEQCDGYFQVPKALE